MLILPAQETLKHETKNYRQMAAAPSPRLVHTKSVVAWHNEYLNSHIYIYINTVLYKCMSRELLLLLTQLTQIQTELIWLLFVKFMAPVMFD